MAAVNYQRHTAALRALLGMEAEAPNDDPAPGYDGPAVWIGPSLAEPLGNPLSDVLKGPDGEYDPSVPALVSDVVAGRGPRSTNVSIEGPQGDIRQFSLTGVPQGGGVLVLARETTLDKAQTQSLRASRDLFRDIALCAAGFAFETCAKGLLQWTGPGKPLGYAPETLIGHPAKDLLLPQSPDAFDPFAAREPIDDVPVWMNSLDQGPRSFRMSVRPVIDGAGVWRGVRGHARDETGELRQARRDRFCQDVVHALRGAHGPRVLLRAIAAAAVQACGASAAWVFCGTQGEICAASQSDAPCETMRQIAARTIHDGVQFPSLFAANDRTGLAIALRAQDQTQGALLIAGPAGGEGPSREAQEMLRLVASMAAVAVAHANLTSRLETHASQDAMTGLLNQSGWQDALETKLKLQGKGAVIAVEGDRFRAFADGLGQSSSDELLIEIAGRLRSLCGPEDFCARLGEAAFALWLDRADDARTAVKTEDIAEAFRVASRRMSLALAVSPVIGVAHVAVGSPVTAEELTAQASQAMSAAKRRVRGRGAANPCSKT